METKSDRLPVQSLIGKMVVSKTGKKFGEVGDIVFETRSGEIIYLVLKNPTPYADTFQLERDEEGNYQIPFNAVMAIGDFVVVAEEDIV